MILQTERTFIKPLSHEDFDSLLEMYKEPKSFEFISPFKNKTESFFLKFLEGKLVQNESQIGFWTVHNKLTNKVMGTMNLYSYDPLNIIHLGGHLKNEFWNQGYGKELFQEILTFGFEERKLQHIHAIVETRHAISKKLLTSLGFKLFKTVEMNGEILEILKISSKT